MLSELRAVIAKNGKDKLSDTTLAAVAETVKRYRLSEGDERTNVGYCIHLEAHEAISNRASASEYQGILRMSESFTARYGVRLSDVNKALHREIFNTQAAELLKTTNVEQTGKELIRQLEEGKRAGLEDSITRLAAARRFDLFESAIVQVASLQRIDRDTFKDALSLYFKYAVLAGAANENQAATAAKMLTQFSIIGHLREHLLKDQSLGETSDYIKDLARVGGLSKVQFEEALQKRIEEIPQSKLSQSDQQTEISAIQSRFELIEKKEAAASR